LVYLLGFQPTAHSFEIFGESDEKYHIIGGNQQLPMAIANALGNVKTGWRMLAISRTAAGAVELTFSTPNGTRVVTADYVILTLPFAVLRDLNYTCANFDSLKQLAIRDLGRGRN